MKYAFQNTGLTGDDIFGFLNKCDRQFTPFLSSTVNLKEYSEKLYLYSTTIHATHNNDIVGLVAFYTDNKSHESAFISLICVLKEYSGAGIGSRLMEECISLVKKNKLNRIKLEVSIENQNALLFYKKFGFFTEDQKQNVFLMIKLLN